MNRRQATQKRRVITWDELTYKHTSIDDTIADLKRNDYCIATFGVKARNIILPPIKEDEEYNDEEYIHKRYPYDIENTVKRNTQKFWYEKK